MSTRSQTFVWEIGYLTTGDLSGVKLPSQREVLKCYFYFRKMLKFGRIASKDRALMLCVAFWEAAKFPSDVFQNIKKKFDGLLTKYEKLIIHKDRNTDTEIKKRISFQELLDTLFDITHYTTLKQKNYTEKKMFLFLHKKPGRPSNLTAAIFISAEDQTIFLSAYKKINQYQRK